jgi:opacity protein-like surface antigen
MRSFTTLVIAAAGGIMLAAAAQAADRPEPYIPPPEYVKPPLRPTEIMSGWYLRGDVGYRQNTVGSADSVVPVTDYSYDKGSVAFGAGFGYKYNFLRWDITADFGLPYQYRANTALGTPYYGGKIHTITGLFNGYIDFGTWWGLTPYVGAGIGASGNYTSDWIVLTQPASLSASNGRASLAWAYMGGVSYQFSKRMLLDVGYRYLHLGDTQAGPDVNGNITDIKNLSAKELRIGVRYLLD